MRLYHFTSRTTLPAIQRTGLLHGSVPAARTGPLNAVWLTTDPGPDNHGLSQGGRFMTDDERREAQTWSGTMPPPGTRHSKDASARIAVDLAESDRDLHQWLSWARRNLTPEQLAAIHPVGASLSAAKTWRLYFGIILAAEFVAVDLIEPSTARAA